MTIPRMKLSVVSVLIFSSVTMMLGAMQEGRFCLTVIAIVGVSLNLAFAYLILKD